MKNLELHFSCLKNQKIPAWIQAINLANKLIKDEEVENHSSTINKLCFQGNLELLTYLFNQLKENNIKIQNGNSLLNPLASSVMGGDHIEIVKFLIAQNEDPNKPMEVIEGGKTALHSSVQHNRPLSTDYLLNNGANCRAVDDDKRTPLHIASIYGAEKVIENVIKHAPDLIDAKDKDLNTAVHLAIKNGKDLCLRHLLANGAKNREINKIGECPLLLAVKENQIECLLTLGTMNKSAPFSLDSLERAIIIAEAGKEKRMLGILIEMKQSSVSLSSESCTKNLSIIQCNLNGANEEKTNETKNIFKHTSKL